jgi:hypothetical protein
MTSLKRLAGIAQVSSLFDIPVRTLLSIHPTLMATSFSSFASGMMWHCGFAFEAEVGDRV